MSIKLASAIALIAGAAIVLAAQALAGYLEALCR